MTNYYDGVGDLTINDAKHWNTMGILQPGDVKSGEAWCGVARLYDIKWKKKPSGFFIASANVDMFMAPFKETNVASKEKTDHRVMMEQLKLWEKFELFKSRVCEADGTRRIDFRPELEKELVYGFTRKKNSWYGTSCTLNSWVLTNYAAADVVRTAGDRGSDKVKELRINLIPYRIWSKLSKKLRELTLYDGQPWTLDWAQNEKVQKPWWLMSSASVGCWDEKA